MIWFSLFSPGVGEKNKKKKLYLAYYAVIKVSDHKSYSLPDKLFGWKAVLSPSLSPYTAAERSSFSRPISNQQVQDDTTQYFVKEKKKSHYIKLFLLWNFYWPVKYFYIYYTFNENS